MAQKQRPTAVGKVIAGILILGMVALAVVRVSMIIEDGSGWGWIALAIGLIGGIALSVRMYRRREILRRREPWSPYSNA